ncbi:MAG: S41 family peptidase [Kiloniellaceae bacterium]
MDWDAGESSVSGYLSWAFHILLLLGLSACAQQQIVPGQMTPEDATRTLRTTFQYIQAKYLYTPLLDVYSEAGLRNLAILDPALSLHDAGTTTELLYNGKAVYTFEPPPADRPDAWANTIRRTLEAATEFSPAIAETSWDRRIDVVLAGSAESLGRHAGYSSHDKISARRKALEQNQGDLAILLSKETDPPTLTQVQLGSAAEAAGLRAGDVLWKINGEALAGMSAYDIEYKLAGAVDTQLTLDVSGPTGEDRRSVALRREKVDLTDPVVRRLGRLLYFQFSQMIHTSNDKVREALEADLAKGEDRASGIILDLRGAVAPHPWLVRDLVQFFLGEESVYTSAGRDFGDWYPDWDEPLLPDVPLVVLQNGATETAAEAVSAAFGDLGRAVVVGTVSHGNGKILTRSGLLNGGFIWFPTEEIYTAAEYPISDRGVMPIVCTAEAIATPTLPAKLHTGEGVLTWRERTQHVSRSSQAARDTFRALCPPHNTSPDIDIEVARAILEDSALYASILHHGQRGAPPARK